MGIAEIDNQHKELMSYINYLISLSTEYCPANRNYSQKKADAAMKQMVKHFETEENLLSMARYERLDAHKKEHENLMDKAIEIMEEVKNTNRVTDLYCPAVTLKEWILSHFLLYDKAAKEHFAKGYK